MAPRHPKKRQTRLSFDPVSPETRYATVIYEGSPAKKRKTSGQQKLDLDLLRSDGPSSSTTAAIFGPATPARSSQVPRGHDRSYNVDDDDNDDGRNLTDSDSDDEVVRPKKGRGRRDREEPTSSIFSRAAIISPRTEKVAMRTAKGKQKVMPHDDTDADESDEDEQKATPAKTTTKPYDRKGRQPPVQVISSDEEAEGSRDSDEDSDEDIQTVTPIRRQAAKSSSTVKISDNDSDEEEDDEDDVRPSTQRRRPQTPSEADSSNSKEKVARSPRKRLARRGQASQHTPPSSDTADPDNESDKPDEEGQGDVQEVSSSHRRLRRRRTPSDDDDSEAAEVAAEANELKKSTVFHKHRGGRLRNRTGNSKINDRRSRLEELKARREGRAVEVSNEDEDDDEEASVEDHDENDFPGSDTDNEEDDFVIDDEEEARARYEAGDSVEHIELELMRHGQRSLKEHFMYVVKGMVSARLNPGEPQEVKQLYVTSTKRVNREAAGLADRLVSTVWVEPFLRVIRARPDYQEMELGGIDREAGGFGGRCSACDRSGHPPSFVAVLRGKAYSRDKLEPLKDDDDDADETSEDEEGHKLVDEDREWHLGSFCRSNAINAHSLIHWRIHLRDWLNAYLEAGHHFSTEATVKRDRMSTKQRAKVVETIMDELEDTRQIRRLWHEFKAKLVAAPEVKGQRWGRP